MWRWPLRAALAIVALPVLYVLVALLLGVIPVNREFRPTDGASGGVTVYLRTNGVHTDLVVPAAAPHDWRGEFPPESLIDAARLIEPHVLQWIAFGWGDREFFLQTRTWRDLRLRTTAVALFGLGRGAMHVEYLAQPLRYDVQRIDLHPQQYRALVAALRAGFLRGADGQPQRIDARGYFGTDAFYLGHGRFTPWLTCNEWIRRVLAGAGVRTAVWAPFDVVLFWHLS